MQLKQLKLRNLSTAQERAFDATGDLDAACVARSLGITKAGCGSTVVGNLFPYR